jgi:glucose/arabinose dehydrogenase
LIAAAGGPVAASTPPQGFAETVVLNGSAATGAQTPTAVGYEPVTGHLWVLEKGGASAETTARVRRKDVTSGVVTTALTLSCVDGQGERGLLGIAFSPSWQQPGGRHVYLYYTRRINATGPCAESGQAAGARNRVSRFTESGGVLSGEQVILDGPNLSAATNHNGGTLRFAPDGTLFVSMGDNNTDADPNPLSRDRSDLRGKILRVNANGSIPLDNPFYGQAGIRPEIWAWGLRNPFRFGIDSQTGAVLIGDVGEITWEMIDIGVPGGDYGYPCFEGPAPFQPCNPAPAPGTVIPPAYYYGHGSQTLPVVGASVTGGPVYRHTAFPTTYQGSYFFGDYISGWIRRATIGPGNQLTDVHVFLPDATTVVDIAVSPAGCLTWVGISGQGVREVCFTGSDDDGDGFYSVEDCDDGDPTSYPGAAEVCDGNDNACNGTTPANELDPDADGLAGCLTWNDVQGDDPAITGGGDNCPAATNPTQADFDADGVGDACETAAELADADRSGRVDGLDLARLGRAFADSCGGGRYQVTVDFDRNCQVDGDDLALFAPYFGATP